MPRKRLKHPPTRAETGDLPPRPAWPSWSQGKGGRWLKAKPERAFKHTEWKSGGPGQIAMHFAKGNGGRRYGSHNTIGHNLKVAILDAAARCKHSNDGTLEGFLLYCAETFPQDYLRVVGKLIPYRYNIEGTMRHLQTADEIKAELRARGVPVPDCLFARPTIPPNVVRLEPRPIDHAHPLIIDNNEEANDADNDPPQAAE
jgi:hypothetical protein